MRTPPKTPAKAASAEQNRSHNRLYVVRTRDKVSEKCAAVLNDFVDRGGNIFVATRDKVLRQNVRLALVNEMQMPTSALQFSTTMEHACELIDNAAANSDHILWVDNALNARPSPHFLRPVKKHGPRIKSVVVADDIDEHTLALFQEAGADNIATKPVSPDMVLKKTAFTLQPQSMEGRLVDKGERFLDVESFDQALLCAEKILSLSPDSAKGLVIKGDALRAKAKREEAMAAYKGAEEKHKKFLAPLKRMVEMHREDGDEEKALACMTRMDAISPLNIARKVAIGEMYARQGDIIQAETYIGRALEIARDESKDAAAALARDVGDRLMNSRPGLSAVLLRYSVDMLSGGSSSGQLMDTYNRLGLALRAEGKWKEAAGAYREAMQYSPHDENLQYNMAMAYAEGGKFSEAADRIRKAFDLNPDFAVADAGANYRIGRIFHMSNDPDSARHFYEKAQELDPHHYASKKALGTLPSG